MAFRFDVLDIDVDLDDRSGKKKPEKTRAKNDENPKKGGNKANKKKKAASDETSLHSMAFGNNKGKNKKKHGKGAENQQVQPPSQPNQPNQPNQEKPVSPAKTNGEKPKDDEWHRRDDEFVRDANERALQEALMMSKLDFEEKKDFYAQMKKEQKEDPKGGKVKKKKDRPVKMSLDQFNSLRPDQMTGKLPEPVVTEKATQEETQEGEKFFDNIEEAARKTLERERRHENYKATAGEYNQEVRASQYEAELEKRDFEIQALRLEVDCLKNELKAVKGRNKKLCEVICSAEMKSKAELVVELDKMSKVREELTQEVSSLSGQVEQERSKVNQLTLDCKKLSGKKKQHGDGGACKD